MGVLTVLLDHEQFPVKYREIMFPFSLSLCIDCISYEYSIKHRV